MMSDQSVLSRRTRMYWTVLLVMLYHGGEGWKQSIDDPPMIQVFDLTHATTWRDMTDYYDALERRWKICYNCGVPALGTGMHLEYSTTKESMQPAVIPTEYLLTRLVIIDVSSLVKNDPALSLTLDAARQWIAIKQDPTEPTLLLFKFGWTERPEHYKRHKCICEIPGLSYELAQWIAANLSHVVGVATDAPTLESQDTRELTTRTVTNLLGRSGIYMIENVNLRRRIPESGCMTISMPLKLLSASYVPARLTAFCPPRRSGARVVLAQRPPRARRPPRPRGRADDLGFDEILSFT